jgi:hypothetical protein
MFRCLPFLGVNRNYQREFCTLSWQYHGLELVDWPVEKLCADVFFMVQNWHSDSIVCLCLRNAYELLQMETGLEGNIFSYNFSEFGCLATHSWMKILWNYLDHLQVTLELDDSTNIPPVRQDDFSIMNFLISRNWRGGRLIGANRWRKHKKVHRGSCVTAMDGYTLLGWVLNKDPGDSSRVWSHEEPTREDYNLWCQAVKEFTSTPNRLFRRLGPLLSLPHSNASWRCDDDQTTLSQSLGNGSFSLYKVQLPFRFTRRGTPFVFLRFTSIDPGLSNLATVTDVSHPYARLHSFRPIPPPKYQPTSFLDILHSWDNQSLCWRKNDLEQLREMDL